MGQRFINYDMSPEHMNGGGRTQRTFVNNDDTTIGGGTQIGNRDRKVERGDRGGTSWGFRSRLRAGPRLTQDRSILEQDQRLHLHRGVINQWVIKVCCARALRIN